MKDFQKKIAITAFTACSLAMGTYLFANTNAVNTKSTLLQVVGKNRVLFTEQIVEDKQNSSIKESTNRYLETFEVAQE